MMCEGRDSGYILLGISLVNDEYEQRDNNEPALWQTTTKFTSEICLVPISTLRVRQKEVI